MTLFTYLGARTVVNLLMSSLYFVFGTSLKDREEVMRLAIIRKELSDINRNFGAMAILYPLPA